MSDKKQTLQKVIALNISLVIAEIIAGIYSGSMALIADAFHNLGDVLALFISLIAIVYGAKKASESMTFGYVKAEIMAAFINSLFLIITMIFILVESINRFLNPSEINAPIVIFASLIALCINAYSTFLLKQNNIEHHHDHGENEHHDHHHEHEDMNMKSAYLHLLTDMLASVAVLIGGLVMKFFGWFWMDSVMTILIAIYLIIVGFDLIIKSTKMLMLFTPENIDIKEIIREVHKIPGAGRLHHIHVWHLNEEEIHLEAHLECTSDISITEFNTLLNQIEMLVFEKFGINHITIQPEFKKEDPKDFIVQD